MPEEMINAIMKAHTRVCLQDFHGNIVECYIMQNRGRVHFVRMDNDEVLAHVWTSGIVEWWNI